MPHQTVTVLLGVIEVPFKVVTGTAVATITKEIFKALNFPHLKPVSEVLFKPAKQKLNVLDQLTEHLTRQHNSAEAEIYVVEGLKTDLL